MKIPGVGQQKRHEALTPSRHESVPMRKDGTDSSKGREKWSSKCIDLYLYDIYIYVLYIICNNMYIYIYSHIE